MISPLLREFRKYCPLVLLLGAAAGCGGAGGAGPDAGARASPDQGCTGAGCEGQPISGDPWPGGQWPPDGGNPPPVEGEGEGYTPPPQCPAICVLDQAESECDFNTGQCLVTKCETGNFDADQAPENGCEYKCSLTNGGLDDCDGVDNDCDGLVDNGGQIMRDPLNCARCGNACPGMGASHLTPTCIEGQCGYECEAGWYDNNSNPLDGCESQECIPTSQNGEDPCDGEDNDCDGLTDEDMDTTLAISCGPACVNCLEKFGPNVQADCNQGKCRFLGCQPGHYDTDGNPENGCEGVCQPTDPPYEVCDLFDNDCDPTTPDGKEDPMVGATCEADMPGICHRGGLVCAYGNLVCGQEIEPAAEICDDKDNDCDGVEDNPEATTLCPAGWTCVFGDCTDQCIPSCGTKVCGDNGCGGSCGNCPAGKLCDAQGQCATCQPSCIDRECGDDGCGGNCGDCAAPLHCQTDGKCGTAMGQDDVKLLLTFSRENGPQGEEDQRYVTMWAEIWTLGIKCPPEIIDHDPTPAYRCTYAEPALGQAVLTADYFGETVSGEGRWLIKAYYADSCWYYSGTGVCIKGPANGVLRVLINNVEAGTRNVSLQNKGDLKQIATLVREQGIFTLGASP